MPDAQATAKEPLGAEKLEVTPAQQAEAAILRGVGAQPTDELDRGYISGTADPTPRAATTK